MKKTKEKRTTKKLPVGTSLILLNAIFFLLFVVHYSTICCILASELAFYDFEAKYFVGQIIIYAFRLLRYQGLISLISVVVYYLSAIADSIGEENRLLEKSGHWEQPK